LVCFFAFRLWHQFLAKVQNTSRTKLVIKATFVTKLLFNHFEKQTMFFWPNRSFVLACFALSSLAFQPAHAIEVSGVNYNETIDVAGEKLQLNGVGIRYKAVFKVYTMGLYTNKKASTPEEVWAMPGNKRFTLTMLREIDAAELGRLFTRGIQENNTQADTTRSLPDVMRMGVLFGEHKTLKPGEVLEVNLVRGAGVQISIKGKPVGEPFKDPAFFKLMLNIWLGKNPADWKLKDALLGK
jgi:Chalcone isomerase-like